MNKNRKKILSLWMSSLVAIIGLTAGCSPGGSTGDEESASTTESGASHILFASQYDRLSAETAGAWTRTKEGGLVYVAAGWDGGIQDQAGKWDYGYFETNSAGVIERQAYGKQWSHDTPLDANDTIYITVKGPNGGSIDASRTDTLVIQMGNGAASSNANSHNIFTVTLNGGIQNQNNYNWDQVCSVDQTVSSTHNFGLSTYNLPLGSFSCSSGTLSGLKSKFSEVVVKVVGGKNPDQDNTTTANFTMPTVGFIGLTNSTAVINDNSSTTLFASQYSPVTVDNDSTVKFQSNEGGYVRVGEGGNFTYGDWGTWDANDLAQRQGFGVQYKHNSATTSDGNSFIYYAISAPHNSAVDVSNTNSLVVQMGNGVNIASHPNTHKVFTVELNGDSDGAYPWDNSCSVDQQLDNVSLVGATGSNPFGLGTYRIDLSNLSCTNGDLTTLKGSVNEVVVKVVGGKDNAADNLTDNYLLPMVGFVGFSN